MVLGDSFDRQALFVHGQIRDSWRVVRTADRSELARLALVGLAADRAVGCVMSVWDNWMSLSSIYLLIIIRQIDQADRQNLQLKCDRIAT